jgi:hypothetical protein
MTNLTSQVQQDASVSVVTSGDNPVIQIDPCLAAFGVGRQVGLKEMNLPGSVPPERPLPSMAGLSPEGKKLAYQKAKLPWLQEIRPGAALIDKIYVYNKRPEDGTVYEDKRAYFDVYDIAEDCVVSYRNPNVVFMLAEELAEHLGVADSAINPGACCYVPRDIARGSLIAFTGDSKKQTTKLQVHLPHGFHLLDGWFKAEDRYLKLQRDKFSA